MKDAVTATQLRHSLTSSQTSRDIDVITTAGGERLTTVHGVHGNGSHDDVEMPRSDRSEKYADDSVAVVTAVCVASTLLIVLIAIVAAILVRYASSPCLFSEQSREFALIRPPKVVTLAVNCCNSR